MRQHWCNIMFSALLVSGAWGQVGRPVMTSQGLLSLVDYPDAISTQIWSVNGRGEMVGVYASSDRAQHGFLYSNGRFTSIDFPGAAITLVNGINAQGDIVGEYGLSATGPRKGFLLSGGRFTTIEYPDGSSSGVLGIAANGDILGYYGNPLKGYLLRGDQYTSIVWADAPSTVVAGMTPRGDVLGSYFADNVATAFVYRQGEFQQTWAHPEASGFTNAVGGNAAGDIVGRYLDSARVSHGYLLSGGVFTSFDCPGASFTGAAGITPEGDIVGRCTVNGVSHGFVLKQGRQPRYKVTDLGTLGGNVSAAFGISNAGLISGTAAVANGDQHPFLWRDGRMMDLGTLGGANGVGTNPTGATMVPVVSETAQPDPFGADFCDFGTHRTCLAAIWRDGHLTAMPTLGGNNAIGFGMNERGQMAGVAETNVEDPSCPAPQKLAYAPVLWTAGTAQRLRLPAGDTVGFAITVNDRGEVAGSSGNCQNTYASATGFVYGARAVLWENGVPRDLGQPVPGALSLAVGINNRTEVVGGSLLADGSTQGYVWSRAGGMVSLPAAAGDPSGLPASINNQGQVVGASCDAEMNCRAALWERGEAMDLNELVPEDSNLYLAFATWINDTGEIVGFGFDKATEELRAFLLSPARPAVGTAPKSRPLRTAQPVSIRRQAGRMLRLGIK